MFPLFCPVRFVFPNKKENFQHYQGFLSCFVTSQSFGISSVILPADFFTLKHGRYFSNVMLVVFATLKLTASAAVHVSQDADVW